MSFKRYIFLFTIAFLLFCPCLVAQIQLGQDLIEGTAGDKYGFSTCLSADGLYLAVGAPYLNVGGDIQKGQVTTYSWDGNQWLQRGSKLQGDEIYDSFGWSVTMTSDGQTLVVGLPENNDVFKPLADRKKGAVKVYDWNDSIHDWSQRGSTIGGDIITAGDRFGWDVAISDDGNKVVTSAVFHDSNRGYVETYQWIDSLTSWVKIDSIPGLNQQDIFGFALDMTGDGNFLGVAGFQPSDQIVPNNFGYVKCYAWQGNTWVDRGPLIQGEAKEDFMGSDLAFSLSGDTIAVASRKNDQAGMDAGKAYIYTYSGSTWNQLGSGILGESSGDFFGSALDISGDGKTLAIAARANDNFALDAGNVRIFRLIGNDWQQIGAEVTGKRAFEKTGEAYNGLSMSKDGRIFSIGSPYSIDSAVNLGGINGADLNGIARVYSICDAPLIGNLSLSISDTLLCNGDSVDLIFSYGNNDSASADLTVRALSDRGDTLDIKIVAGEQSGSTSFFPSTSTRFYPYFAFFESEPECISLFPFPDTLNISVVPEVPSNISLAVNSQVICTGDSIQLSAELLLVDSTIQDLVIEVLAGPNDTLILSIPKGEASGMIVLSPSVDMTFIPYIIYYEGEESCVALLSGQNSVSVSVRPEIPDEITLIGPFTTPCNNDIIELTAQVGNMDSAAFSISVDLLSSQGDTLGITISQNEAAGSANLFLTESISYFPLKAVYDDLPQCAVILDVKDSVRITVKTEIKVDSFKLDLSTDSICEPTDVNVGIQLDQVYTEDLLVEVEKGGTSFFLLVNNGSLNADTLLNFTESTTIRLISAQYISVNSCQRYLMEPDTFRVSLINCDTTSGGGMDSTMQALRVPDILTPNGDGFNDIWTVKGGAAFRAQIFNRSGGKIYDSDQSGGSPWTGDNQPAGDYIYIVTDLRDNSIQRGVLTLIR